jgi:hypothetical protein
MNLFDPIWQSREHGRSGGRGEGRVLESLLEIDSEDDSVISCEVEVA